MPVGPAAQGHAWHRPQQEAESGGAMGGAHHEERRRPRTSRACIVSEVRTRPEISQLRAHVWVTGCARVRSATISNRFFYFYFYLLLL